MQIKHEIIEVKTDQGICVYNLTPEITKILDATSIRMGHVLVFCRHTTTALAINENETRLLEDIKNHLGKLAPQSAKYLHDDLHLRDVPEDEPMNAHAHLMALMLNNSEVVPIVDSQLALGTWQSVLFFELDGPRRRTVFVQVWGE